MNTQSGILNTIATILVATGVVTVQSDILLGVFLLILGGAVYVGTEVLKSKGYNLSGIVKK